MTASKPASGRSRDSPSIVRTSTLSSAWRFAFAAAYSRIRGAMSVASTRPSVPTRRAALRVCSPAPAATSSTWSPCPIRAMSSMSSVTGPSQRLSVSPHRCHASAASCHWRRVVSLYWIGSNALIAASFRGRHIEHKSCHAKLLKCRGQNRVWSPNGTPEVYRASAAHPTPRAVHPRNRAAEPIAPRRPRDSR